MEDQNSLAAMERALDLGIYFIDTADVYSDGHSEELVSQVIKGRRERVIVATKGGLMGHHRDPKREPVYDRPENVRVALENSLRRLGTDYVDVYFDQHGGLDVVQLEYSTLNRQAERQILLYLQEHGIGVVVRGPLQKGLLTGRFRADATVPEGDVRHSWPNDPWFRQSVEKVERLRALEREGRTLGQLALRFVLSHPVVSTAIPGGKTPEQVEENAGASVRPLLSEEELRLIEEVALVTS